MKQHPFCQSGFTLMEVLVALAVLAISMGAIIKAGAEGAGNAALLRDQTLASWVALNQVNEVLLARDWPAPGDSRGTAEMASQEWHWELRISTTADPDLLRLDMAVRRSRDAAISLAELTAFKGRR